MNHINQLGPFLPPYNLIYSYRNPYLPYYYHDEMKELNQQNTYRSEVLKWFSRLDINEQYQIFKIKGQMCTIPILQMYIYDRLFVPSHYGIKYKQLNLKERFDDQFSMKSIQLHSRAEEFYELLHIIDEEQFMDTIILVDGALDKQGKFIELLQNISNYQFLSKPLKVTNEKVEDPEWFSQKYYRSCIEWIMREYEKNIAFYFAISHDKKKKIKNHNQTTIKNNNIELQKYFQLNIAHNKEKLIKYYGQITNEISKKPNNIENIFYSNIFQSPAITTYKSQSEIQTSFIQKCNTDQNIINSMLIIKMSELIEQKTYYLKKFYPLLLNLYQEHLEQELFSCESQYKSKSSKKKKKKKQSENIQNELNGNDSSIQNNILNELTFNENLTKESQKKEEALIESFEMQEISKTITVQELQVENLFESYKQSKFQEEEQWMYISQEVVKLAILQSYSCLNLELEFEVEQRNQQSQKQTNKKKKQKNQAQINNDKSNKDLIAENIIKENDQKDIQEPQLIETSFKKQVIDGEGQLNQQEIQKQYLIKTQTYQNEEDLIQICNSQDEHECLALSQSTECSVNLNIQQKNKCEKSMTIIIEDDTNLGKEKMFEFITLDIINFTDIILKEYDDLLPFRQLVYDRVKIAIQSLFFLPDDKIKLFGSCATGLALIDSDIDIGISSFENFDKQSLRQPFHQLYNSFLQTKWVTKAKSIFNTMVPVIKLEIDPLINFSEFDSRYLNLDDNHIRIWKQIKQKLKSGIKVDITFSFHNNHLGYESTDMIMKWMLEYPNIQQLVLILKTIIKRLGYSESYKGGLSSFSLIIMVYSYLRENRVKNDQLGHQFLDMIYFFSHEFAPDIYGIGLPSLDQFIKPNQPSYFFQLKDYCLPPLPITIFSPINNRLISAQCVHIDKLLLFFKKIYDQSQQNLEFFNSYVTYGKKKQQRLSREIKNFITQILIMIDQIR
ncbi:unnamed protein product [Paramecium sonneborni]|uniref:Poly(A) RNA polymerase mitochondrial-like central palm domain-containing protein n=1 Tax=Paramecium sonneborni TaxID=65129 RepID=A0A8S1QHX4_9CILI|nr:unnamed protein product [Paramecium sonneborni]